MSTEHDTRLTFVRNTTTGRAIYRCSCDRNEKEYDCKNVQTGNTKSCNCLKKELVAKFNAETKTKHGYAGTPLYQVWQGAKQRCNNPKHKKWKDYGGRGIRMCAHLQESFDNFIACVGPRPDDDRKTIDRTDNDGGYWCGRSDCSDCGPAKHPMNLAWVTKKRSSNNTRTNRPIKWKGRTQTLAEWAADNNINPNLLRMRLNAGWSMDDALTAEVRKYTKNKEVQ